MSDHRESIEELLELCLTAQEDGMATLDRHALPKQLVCFLPYPIHPNGEVQQGHLDEMVKDGLLVEEGRHIRLSADGTVQAQMIARRHRLTEVLLHNVLDVSEDSMERTACQVEHILNTEVTEAVCTFLGHPPSCPHGRAIPRGHCCEAASSKLEPLIIPIEQLAIGQAATVAFLHTHTVRHGYLQRLSAFGLAPGSPIRLRQKQPALVIQIHETELALDHRAGREIFVRRSHHSSPGQSQGFTKGIPPREHTRGAPKQ